MWKIFGLSCVLFLSICTSQVIAEKIELRGTTTTKQKVDIADYKGKVVLIDVWATWCGPCIKETPRVKALYRKYGQHGFDVIGVSCDKNLATLTSYLKKNAIPWKNTYTTDGNADFLRANGIRGIPHFILVAADGSIIKAGAAPQELDLLISRALNPDKNRIKALLRKAIR